MIKGASLIDYIGDYFFENERFWQKQCIKFERKGEILVKDKIQVHLFKIE